MYAGEWYAVSLQMSDTQVYKIAVEHRVESEVVCKLLKAHH